MKRIETGPLQIGDDWPGVFICGDNALMGYAPALRDILNKLQPEAANVIQIYTLRGLLSVLESCAATEDPPEQHITFSKGKYKHKNGGVYELIDEGYVQTSEPLIDYDEVVVYKSVSDGKIWIRPKHEFFDGRFTEIS